MQRGLVPKARSCPKWRHGLGAAPGIRGHQSDHAGLRSHQRVVCESPHMALREDGGSADLMLAALSIVICMARSETTKPKPQ